MTSLFLACFLVVLVFRTFDGLIDLGVLLYRRWRDREWNAMLKDEES